MFLGPDPDTHNSGNSPVKNDDLSLREFVSIRENLSLDQKAKIIYSINEQLKKLKDVCEITFVSNEPGAHLVHGMLIDEDKAKENRKKLEKAAIEAMHKTILLEFTENSDTYEEVETKALLRIIELSQGLDYATRKMPQERLSKVREYALEHQMFEKISLIDETVEKNKLHPAGSYEQSVEEYKDLILAKDAYEKHPYNLMEDNSPYVFEFKSGNKKLVFFGTPHTNDPANPVFNEIQGAFHATNPGIVYVEGMSFINVDKDAVCERTRLSTLEQAKSEGEGYFTLKLAIDSDRDFESPEPELSEEISYLSNKKFKKEDILKYYIYRQIEQYQREHEVKNIEEGRNVILRTVKIIQSASGWESMDLDGELEKILSTLSLEDQSFYYDATDPLPQEGKQVSITNDIARNSMDFRDRHIFERVAEGLKVYDKVFVTYGASHSVRQEPAFRALFQNEF